MFFVSILQASHSTLKKTEVAVTDVKSFLLSGTVYQEQKAALSHLVSQTEAYCNTLKVRVLFRSVLFYHLILDDHSCRLIGLLSRANLNKVLRLTKLT